jgi:hypothetical protein
MTEHHDAIAATTARERELELEVGRLKAELETLQGDDPAAATSRFLAMAAATVDLAVADARREADEIVEEVSAQAEARRDEATRVAAEAEALAEQMLEDADRCQSVIDEAAAEAASIRAAAEVEAANLVAKEREKVAEEVSALAEVREALETERGALESYHETLRRRVQELAESMVSFMTSEAPLGVGAELSAAVPPQLEAVLAESPDADPSSMPSVADGAASMENPTEWSDETDSVDGPELVAPVAEQIVDVPDAAIDEIPDGPVVTFGGVPVIEDADEADEVEDPRTDDSEAENREVDGALVKPSSAGLFSRARSDEQGFEDLEAALDGESGDESSLFGTLGPRLVEQTSPAELSDALESSDSQDEAFRQFIDGDDEPDPSRDWLLRPDQS